MHTLISVASLMLSVSPWILPSIAAATRLAHEAPNACRGEFGQNRSGERGDARTEGRSRNRQAPHARIAAKLAGRNRPER